MRLLLLLLLLMSVVQRLSQPAETASSISSSKRAKQSLLFLLSRFPINPTRLFRVFFSFRLREEETIMMANLDSFANTQSPLLAVSCSPASASIFSSLLLLLPSATYQPALYIAVPQSSFAFTFVKRLLSKSVKKIYAAIKNKWLLIKKWNSLLSLLLFGHQTLSWRWRILLFLFFIFKQNYQIRMYVKPFRARP